MEKKRAFILALMLMLSLSACSKGENPDNSSLGTQDTNNGGLSTPSNSTGSPTDDFLKTITAETAEAKGVCGPDLTWYYQDNVLVIKGTGEMTDYDSNWYTEAPWGEDSEGKLYEKINWVIISEGITSIGKNAFYNCPTLSKVEMPSTLERIGESAFYTCENLKDITIPSSVTLIDSFSFNCNERTSVTFLGDAPEGAQDAIWGCETVYYGGSGFDELIAQFPTINWVKQ